MSSDYILWLDQLRATDVDRVGGKNASLGEMISQLSAVGVSVPNGFATTARAFRDFLALNGLDQRIAHALSILDIQNVAALAQTSREIRNWMMEAPLPARLQDEIIHAYEKMQLDAGNGEVSVAVRSSATAEDLADASFAGQQETLLNICGSKNLLTAVKHVFTSLYSDRAIAYRVHKGFVHADVALSVGIQHMVRSDVGASGVIFTLDTESGFDQVVLITASYGLGEAIVQGIVNPDEFYVYKPSLIQGKSAIIKRNLGSKRVQIQYAQNPDVHHTVETRAVPLSQQHRFAISDEEVEELARQALIIERHYQKPMDIEWGKDGISGRLYILQARPETVQSHIDTKLLRSYHLKNKSKILVSGRAIGQKIGSGPARLILNVQEMSKIQEGDILVTDMTDPDWEPIMKRAAAIVTNRGGRTCHAAIVARELGIPAVVGCNDATEVLMEGQIVTASCAEGDEGYVFDGALDIEITELALESMPSSPVKIAMNIGNPDLAFDLQKLPNHGVGLARLEFIIARMIGVHPKAILDYSNLSDDLKQTIEQKCAGYHDPVQFYVAKLSEGIATIAAAFAPKPVIVRLSDFKSNEYANLIGGSLYEPKEENPMLGFRGASRYISQNFQDCFELECQALKKIRNEMGLTNVEIMIPFVRTLTEARQIVNLLAANGLKRGENGLRLIMMCEIPANALLAEQFLQYFDGFSIGSNDLTQLTLGIDRDSGLVAEAFDERNLAVKALLRQAIDACLQANKYIGICGQGPSDHPDLANWLVNAGIQTLSLNPDSVVRTWLYLAEQSKENKIEGHIT
ncbi:phosphoenolpyruvate synthase [Nitrosomonas sp. Nm166]|uniref:phosphoenolpyruvate synthase n=1 Tax=Nitrosomonas sp. Nm166 TaxID=1881054 RepID=UPI0008E56EF4|nr:phosphoenolpyruvate synthase [Nitrosomonas sp. Nm166]SFE15202.1 pyruvate, water dikinase [Nitrosomonas sp. Nm166]